MKLWQKIFLCTLMLVMLAVGVTSILLLKNSYFLAMEQKKQAAYTEHEFLITNFKSMILTERLRQNEILLKQEVVAKYMQDTFGEGSMKSGIAFYDRNEEPVYQNIRIEQGKDLLEMVSETGENYMQIVGGRLYIASKETIETNTYYFVTAADITDVSSMYRQMLEDARTVGMICAIAIAIILLLVVKLLLIPLQKINAGTRAIAQGEYQKRVPQKGRDELSELARNMNRMAESVEKNVEALKDVAENRKQFIANLSHEMKTPLTSILGFADLLRIKKDISEEDRVEYASIIMEEAGRMRSLSGKLMEMITVGASNVEWKEQDVAALFAETGSSLGIIARSHGIILECSCESGRLWMDRELMKSLIYNLVDNAMKASKEGDAIRICGWFEKEPPDREFVFTVEDEGGGIPKGEISRITEAFYMVDKARSRARGGAGLGLALCVEIVALHRGELQIDSEPGRGTRVAVHMKGGNEGCTR